MINLKRIYTFGILYSIKYKGDCNERYKKKRKRIANYNLQTK